MSTDFDDSRNSAPSHAAAPSLLREVGDRKELDSHFMISRRPGMAANRRGEVKPNAEARRDG